MTDTNKTTRSEHLLPRLCFCTVLLVQIGRATGAVPRAKRTAEQSLALLPSGARCACQVARRQLPSVGQHETRRAV
jgi:hypothetical protein